MTTPRALDPSEVTLVPVDFDPFADAPVSKACPLSEAQREIWSVVQMGPEASCAYNLCFALRLVGSVSIDALRSAVEQLFARHDALRATFDPSGEGQAVSPPRPLDWPVRDLTGRSSAEQKATLEAAFVEEVQMPFDLVNGPPARVRLFTEAADRCVLLLTVHHIVCDGASTVVLFQDLAAMYEAARRGQPANLPPAQSFIRLVEREAAPEGREQAAAAQAYWEAQFGQLPPPLDLPLDEPRPATKTYRASQEALRLDEGLTAGIKRDAAQQGSTIVAFLLAAFQVLLHRLSGQTDLVVGLTASVRDLSELPEVVGHTTNLLPLRARIDPGTSFATHLRGSRSALLDAQDHRALTFGTLVRRLSLPRDPSRTPLVAVTFNFARGGVPWGFADVQATVELAPRRHLNFELELNVLDTGPVLAIECAYNGDLFAAGTVRRWLEHYRAVLASIVANPGTLVDRLALLTEGGLSELRGWNATEVEISDACVHELISREAEHRPHRAAVEFGGATLSYGELERRAAVLAQRLRGLGVKPGVRVGVFMERSPEMIVGLLGILKAGGAYVPLDPAFPSERLAYMVEDSGAAAILTDGAVSEEVPSRSVPLVRVDEEASSRTAGGPLDEPRARPGDLAYVIYTSGSTGRPKGVAVTHRSLVNLLESMGREPGLAADDVLLSVTTLSFDIAALELYLPLVKGARIALASRPETLDGRSLIERLASSGATVMQATPATWRLLVDSGWEGKAGLKVLCGGEALSRDLAERLLSRAREVWNVYGPTETTVWSSAYRVERGVGAVSIGRPIANTQMWVLDRHLEPMPLGLHGELYIGGAGLAQGYWDRPELTAERFVADPFSATPGARLYRTGDLARWRPDGTLECLGRIDHQVKVRGFRIELGEIEARLREAPGVEDVVVVAQEAAGGDRRLVAYVIGPPITGANLPDLRSHLKPRLPAYMIPSSFVFLDALPLTPNGKVDRKALMSMGTEVEHTRTDQTAPRTATEEILAGIYAEVLRIGRVGVHDDFFELGGHSLLAAQVISRVRGFLGVSLALGELFKAPTVAGLAARVDALRVVDGPTVPSPPLVAERWEGPGELTYAQERFWFLDQLEPGGSAYVIVGGVGLRGTLDPGALEQALGAIVARHEALRTTFASVEGRPVQVVSPVGPWPLPVVDLSGEARPDERVTERMREEARRGFDLAEGPLFRPILYRLAPDSHVLLVCMHHIVSDGWSIGVLVHELSALYEGLLRGEGVALPVLPVQYRDFARWQRKWLQGEMLAREVEHWRVRLAGAPQVLDLPTDHPRPAVGSHRGATATFVLPRTLSDGLAALARREGATLFTTLLAGFALFLSRYTGQEDFLIGSPVSNRNHAEVEALIGCFVNTLTLRASLSGNPTLRDLVARLRDETLDAITHQDLPFEKLVDELRPARDLSRNPLFQVMLVLQNAPLDPLHLQDLALEPIDVDRGGAQVDLTLYVQDSPDGLRGTFEYATALFEEQTIARMAGHWQRLLEGMVESPGARISEMPLLTPAEESQLSRWNATARSYPGSARLHRLIEAQAERTPEAVALAFEGRELTYRELNGRARELARTLRAKGVGPETLVGVFAERSFELVIALLAVLEAGGAYVPLDPSYPAERIAHMLEDARAPLVLAQPHLASWLPAHAGQVLLLDPGDAPRVAEFGEELEDQGTADNLAYVIFTSGSTGRPKGAMNTHRAICNRLWWMQEEYGLLASDRVLQKTTFSFDVSVWEFFWPLLTGATLEIAQPEGHKDNAYLVRLIRQQRITTLHFVPSMLSLFLDEPGVESCSSLTRVICSGEALPYDLQERFFARLPGVKLHNLYGPTEAAVDVTYWACRPRDERQVVPIGVPVANTQMHVLDGYLNPLPVGVAGELYIGGMQVGRGYIRRPELTAERFVPDPFSEAPGARLYKTGDLARHLADGAIEYLGRLDHQVKIRGQRIELGEIEAALRQYPGIEGAVVLVQDVSGGDRRLLAYLSHGAQGQPNVTALRNHLKTILPVHMVPSSFVFLDRLPLTPSGKLDRKALMQLETGRASGARELVPPRTREELFIAALWRDMLGIESVSVRDNFFDLGGHSLLAMRVLAAIEKETGHHLHPRAIIFQTLEQLAAACERKPTSPPPTEPTRGGPIRRLVGALRAFAKVRTPGADR